MRSYRSLLYLSHLLRNCRLQSLSTCLDLRLRWPSYNRHPLLYTSSPTTSASPGPAGPLLLLASLERLIARAMSLLPPLFRQGPCPPILHVSLCHHRRGIGGWGGREGASGNIVGRETCPRIKCGRVDARNYTRTGNAARARNSSAPQTGKSTPRAGNHRGRVGGDAGRW